MSICIEQVYNSSKHYSPKTTCDTPAPAGVFVSIRHDVLIQSGHCRTTSVLLMIK